MSVSCLKVVNITTLQSTVILIATLLFQHTLLKEVLVQLVKRERGEMMELRGYQDQKDPLVLKDHKVWCDTQATEGFSP